MKKLLAVGDSFTYGDELANPEQAWPFQLGKQLGYAVNNLGQSGCSNTSILRRTVQELAVNSYDLVVVGWTIPGRIEWKDCQGPAYDIWPGCNKENRVFQEGAWRLDLLKYITFYHNAEYLYEQYLIQVISLQAYCQTRGIQYRMLNIKHDDRYRKVGINYHSTLAAEVDVECFIGWNQFGMLEIAGDAELGPKGHPLAAGHERIANEIYSRI